MVKLLLLLGLAATALSLSSAGLPQKNGGPPPFIVSKKIKYFELVKTVKRYIEIE